MFRFGILKLGMFRLCCDNPNYSKVSGWKQLMTEPLQNAGGPRFNSEKHTHPQELVLYMAFISKTILEKTYLI